MVARRRRAGRHDTASLLVGLGRVSGLLGAYLVLVELLLLARLPLLERVAGFDRLTAWHRRIGRACLTLLLAHAALVTAGYTIGDRISLPAEVDRLWTGYPGVITATAGLVLLVGVVVTSLAIVRRRLRYETWYFVHLYAYLGVALAFSHQLATGTDFVGKPVARAYWVALYLAHGSARSWSSASASRSPAARGIASTWRGCWRWRRASPRSRSGAATSAG